MEFQYRAGDELRGRSPPPPIPTPSADRHGCDGTAECVENSDVVPRQPPPAAADAEGLRRQAKKAKIRERILREEVGRELIEQWALEEEVKRELMEQLFRQPWPVPGRSAWGPDQPVAPSPARVIAADSSSPVALKVAQAHPKANAPAASPAKRKSPDHAAASTVSAATCSKKQKLSLTCTVCGITANSEKAMQDHLNGKGHWRKAAALAAQPTPEPEHDGEDAAVMAPSSNYTPTKLTMLTNAGTLNEVTQMNGYLLCEVCNVRTADRVTMMCHLEGSKHISKALKKCQAASQPPAAVGAATSTAAKKRVKGHPAPAAIASYVACGEPDAMILEVDCMPHTVRLVEGFLLCELCDVKAPSEGGIRSHLSGKKHKSKVNAGGKVAAKAQAMDKDTAVVADTAAQVEAPLAMPLQAKVGGRSELRETTATSAKEDVTSMDCSKTPGKDAVKVSTTAAAAEANAVGDSDLVVIEAGGVRHSLKRVDGFLVCVCCNVKAPSEIIMRSHLAGKKHRHKMTLAAATNDVGAQGNKKDASVVAATWADQVQGKGSMTAKTDTEAESTPSATPQAKNAAAVVVPMEVDEPVLLIEPPEDGKIVQEAEGEHAATKANGSVIQVKESVETDDTTAPGKPVKIQVEGVVFTVLRQENGRLSCVPCGVHGCDKDGMLLHLYTRKHWDKARLTEEEEACTVAVVDKVGDGGDPASEGTTQLEN